MDLQRLFGPFKGILSSRWALAVCALSAGCLYSTPAFAQCGSLNSPSTSWTGTVGLFGDPTWDNGVPNASTNTCIINGTAILPSNVTLGPSLSGSVLNLEVDAHNTLNVALNSQLTVNGNQIINGGAVNVNGGLGTNTYLELPNSVALSGTGTLTLSTGTGGGNAFLYATASGVTLTNSSTIQGTGYVAYDGMYLSNSGTVNANSSLGIGALYLYDTSGVTNTGVLEATNGGILNVYNTVANGGGNITANGSGSAVQLFGTIQGGTLNTQAGGTMTGFSTTVLDGSTLQGALTISSGSTFTVANNNVTQIAGSIVNNGTIQINGGGGQNGFLETVGTNPALSGGGTVNLTTTTGGGQAYIEQCCGGQTLTNVDNTIQGAGIIGNNGLALVNGGTIDANIAAGTNGSTGVLTLQSIPTTNFNGTSYGLLEATNGGELVIASSTVNNANANLTAGAGSSVVLSSSTIQGGTLTVNTAGGGVMSAANTLFDGFSQGSLTLTAGSTLTLDNNNTNYMVGSVVNNGTIQLTGGGGTNGVLEVYSVSGAHDLTLTGGGTVNLTTTTGGGQAYFEQCCGGQTLTNVDNTIQGAGIIGNNGLTLINGATIDANIAAGTNSSTGVLTLQSVPITNSNGTSHGLLEATNGGELVLASSTVNNANANITASAGSSVVLSSSIIQGGTLNVNTAGGGVMSAANTIFDGFTQGALTLSTGSTLTLDNNNTNYMVGSVVNNGTIQLTGGGGTNGVLQVYSVSGASDLTLSGGGTVNLTTTTGGGQAYLEQCCGGQTLTNVDNTIQGAGIIGNNGLTLVNGGTVNANIAAGTNGSTGILYMLSSPITNSNGATGGLLEATNGGQLYFDVSTINNANGNITAGNGSSVVFNNSTLQGGKLNTLGTGTMTVENSTTLDGVTHGAITVSTGSTLTLANNNTTFAAGTITNKGNIIINGGGGANGYLQITSIGGTSNLTLNGGGTVTLNQQSGGGNALIYQCCGGQTLTNVNNTIQGNGTIGDNGLSVNNQAGGTLLANVSGGTLLLNSSGTLTNAGTMQANAGSTLHSSMALAASTFSGNTLLTGTYNVYGTSSSAGTIQIDALGTTGGEIVNNAATIFLDGVNSNIFDGSGHLDALSAFSNNLETGSFTIADGRDFTTSADIFTNSGLVDIGLGSIFEVGGGPDYDYVQGDGTTQVDGQLTAASIAVNGGILKGTGTVNGNVTVNGGAVAPGDSPGTLTVNGDYAQNSGGALDIVIGGANPGTGYSVLDDINGTVALSGLLDLSSINGFNPFSGETFYIMDFASGAESGQFTSATWANLTNGLDFSVIYNPTDVEVVVSGSILSGTPEPSTWLLFVGGLGSLAVFRLIRGRRVVRRKVEAENSCA